MTEISLIVTLNKQFNSTEHAIVQLRRVKKQFKPLWFNDNINEAWKTRDRYYENKDDENNRFWRNKVTTLIKQA